MSAGPFRISIIVSTLMMWTGCSFHLSMSNGAVSLHSSLRKTLVDALGLKVAISGTHEGSLGWKGTTEWCDEVKGSKLTGVSSNVLTSAAGDASCQLNAWMGPKFFVPHLLLTIGENNNGKYCVQADYVPRGPNAFGSDDSYVGNYFGNEVLAWYENAYSFDGSTALPPSKSFGARMLRSPVLVAVGGLSLSDATSVAETHVKRWLQWVSEGKESEARQRGALNGRDDKLRQFAFRAAFAEATEKFGADLARDVAAGMTGPVAEAYVGGGG